MNFDLGAVLTRARQITWRYKSLWLIGIVISLVSFLFAAINLAHNPAFSSFGFASEVNTQLPPIMQSNVFIILLVILSAFLFVIGISIPSLGTHRVEQGSENVHFGQLLLGVLPYFGRILGIVLLVWVGLFLAILVLVGGFILLSFMTLGIGLICALPLFIILLIGVILVYALMEQAVSAVLVDNLGIISAIRRAWELIRETPRVMTIVSLISYLVAIAAILIISIAMMIPMSGSTSLSRNLIFWTIVFLALYAGFQGFLLTILQSLWTLIYLRLTGSNNQSQPLSRTG